MVQGYIPSRLDSKEWKQSFPNPKSCHNLDLDFVQQLADGTVRLSFDQSRFRIPLDYDASRFKSPIGLH